MARRVSATGRGECAERARADTRGLPCIDDFGIVVWWLGSTCFSAAAARSTSEPPLTSPDVSPIIRRGKAERTQLGGVRSFLSILRRLRTSERLWYESVRS